MRLLLIAPVIALAGLVALVVIVVRGCEDMDLWDNGEW